MDVPFQDHLRPYHQGLHLQFFNEESMRILLDAAGYRVTRSEVDQPRAPERALLAALYWAYGLMFQDRGGIAGSSRIEFLHRAVWRPIKRLTGIRINVFISSMDLRVLALRR